MKTHKLKTEHDYSNFEVSNAIHEVYELLQHLRKSNSLFLQMYCKSERILGDLDRSNAEYSFKSKK